MRLNPQFLVQIDITKSAPDAPNFLATPEGMLTL
jgi:hypothetical protein